MRIDGILTFEYRHVPGWTESTISTLVSILDHQLTLAANRRSNSDAEDAIAVAQGFLRDMGFSRN